MKMKNTGKLVLDDATKDEIRMLGDKISKLEENFYRIKSYPISAHEAINNLNFDLLGGKIQENKIIYVYKDLIEYLEQLVKELKEFLKKEFN